jgi:hypothetical protein
METKPMARSNAFARSRRDSNADNAAYFTWSDGDNQEKASRLDEGPEAGRFDLHA